MRGRVSCRASHARVSPTAPVGPSTNATPGIQKLSSQGGPAADATSHALEPPRSTDASGAASAVAEADKASPQAVQTAPVATPEPPEPPAPSLLESQTNAAATNVASEKASNGAT